MDGRVTSGTYRQQLALLVVPIVRIVRGVALAVSAWLEECVERLCAAQCVDGAESTAGALPVDDAMAVSVPRLI